MRILILVNTLNSVNSFIYSNHAEFLTKSKELFPKPENEILFFTPPRMSIDMARNTAAREAMRHECDYLMFLDDDVLVPPTALKSLIDTNADIAAGLVIIRGYPFHVMAFTQDATGMPYFDELPMLDIEVEPAYSDGVRGKPAVIKKVLKDPVTEDDGLRAVGFSCALIKVDLLRKVPPPYFITGPRNTEDVYFCIKARETVKDVTMHLVTHIQCGHLLYGEPIEWATIDVFRQFYEDLRPEECKRLRGEEQKGRDEEYIKMCLGTL